MKFILPLLFSMNACAAFTPIGTAPVNYYGLEVLPLGGILTSNGTANGTMLCPDGNMYQRKDSEDSGFECVVPSVGGGSTITIGSAVNVISGTGEVNLQFTYTYNGSNGIKMYLSSYSGGESSGIDAFAVSDGSPNKAIDVGYNVKTRAISSFRTAGQSQSYVYRAPDFAGNTIHHKTPCGSVSAYMAHADLTVGVAGTYGLIITRQAAATNLTVSNCRLIIEEY